MQLFDCKLIDKYHMHKYLQNTLVNSSSLYGYQRVKIHKTFFSVLLRVFFVLVVQSICMDSRNINN